MKKLLVIPALIGLLITGAYASNKRVNDDDDKKVSVSYVVLNHFNADFAGAKNVSWTVTENTQKAQFTLDNVKMTAFYNMGGDFLGTTRQIDYNTVSDRAKKQIAKHYQGYVIGEVIELNSVDGAVQQFVDLKSEKDELLVRVSPTSTVSFFKQVR